MSVRPLVTIGIISCNRFHYLKALIESARECIPYEPIEWIIVDNASIEPGLREYIEGLDFIQHKIFISQRRPSTEHMEAVDRIVSEAKGEYLMVLPEDVQFIVRGRWLEDFVELARCHSQVGTITFDAQRRLTIRHFFGREDWRGWLFRKTFRKQYRIHSGQTFIGYGRSKPGISGAGIFAFMRMSHWRRLGLWKTTGKQTVADSTGGGETEMLARYAKMRLGLQRYLSRIPVCADIITDAAGSKARIRGNRRYGSYFAPPEGTYYYRLWDQPEVEKRLNGQVALAFEDVVEPLGFALPLDQAGNLLKNPHHHSDDPFEWIDPSVVGQDIGSG